MERMCVQVRDSVTQGDSEFENCRVQMAKHDTQTVSNKYDEKMLEHFI